MGSTACTEPQWLYKGDLYLFHATLVTVKDTLPGSSAFNDTVPDINQYSYWNLRFLDILHSVEWYFRTDVSVQPRFRNVRTEPLCAA